MKQADIARDLKNAAPRREHEVARAVTGSPDIRPLLRYIATADDAAVARMMKAMAPTPGHVLKVADETFVYVTDVGYVLAGTYDVIIEYRGPTLAAMGVRLMADAVVSAATPSSMDINGSANSAHVTFVPHGEHRRIEKITVLPHVETVGACGQFIVPTEMTYDASAVRSTMSIIGETKQMYYVYNKFSTTSVKTVEGTRVTIVTASGTRSFLQLHADVTLEKDVYTLETSAGPVSFDASNTIPGGIMQIKGAKYAFLWGTNVRKFIRVGTADEYSLREVV